MHKCGDLRQSLLIATRKEARQALAQHDELKLVSFLGRQSDQIRADLTPVA